MQIFENSIIHKREVPQKIWSYRFSRFDVYWIQTDRQPSNDRYIVKVKISFWFSLLLHTQCVLDIQFIKYTHTLIDRQNIDR